MEERMSFKEMLMRHNGEWEMQEDVEKDVSEAEEEDIRKSSQVQLFHRNLLREEDSAPYNEKRLENISAREGQIFVTDVENGFFFARFSEEKDLSYALTAGSWVLFDHYLAIRSWEPDFHPFSASISRIMAWVRLPSFPVEYMNTELIKEVGNWLGKFIKMDAATTCLARGKFARICVELDLSKPLQADYKIEGKLKNVEYEGLHFVCFACGKYGHRTENCPAKADMMDANSGDVNSKNEEDGSLSNSASTLPNKTDERFGP
ncbi:uncharacterized protein LOC133304935 [Gastrolobium bilobum]|uniref:uncharacterized protein LOC133304935 n=1 Tax=Gastrolobium bilobum TaxID=150636 RepID=UPI002AB07326|nr:uncharacterized protein LOC133304935 [Gastrolobium bilobum]